MRIRNVILPVLAAAGLLFAGGMVLQTRTAPPPPPPLTEPAQSPYATFIGGAGLVEAGGENIAVGIPVAGVVTGVLVKVGEHVTPGNPLLLIDDRAARASLAEKEANLVKAKAERAEAQASLEDYRARYALVRGAGKGGAVSTDEVQQRLYAERLAAAKVETARAAEEVAVAALAAAQVELSRLQVTAPTAGMVLQINIQPGEYAAAGVTDTPAMVLGRADLLQVRVDIDEADAWRFRPETRATAFLRGNREIHTPLEFVRVEPYVVPKTSLTGSSSERVDTRVLQVIYRFQPGQLPFYVGQQVDVTIATPVGAVPGGRT